MEDFALIKQQELAGNEYACIYFIPKLLIPWLLNLVFEPVHINLITNGSDALIALIVNISYNKVFTWFNCRKLPAISEYLIEFLIESSTILDNIKNC